MRRQLLLTLALILAASSAAAQSPSPTVEPYRNPYVAGLKSLVFPGWGQFSNGQSNKGTGLIVTEAVGLLFASDTVSFWSSGSGADLERALGWLAFGLGAVVGAYDAHKNATRMNRENGYLLDEASRPWYDRDEPTRIALFSRKF